MAISRREFVLSAITLAFISTYPKLSYACDVSDVLDKISATKKVGIVLASAGIIMAVPETVPVAIVVGLAGYSITKFPGAEDVGDILCGYLTK